MQAYQMPFKNITIVPKATWAERRYHFVTLDDDGGGIVAAAGKNAIGVAQEPNGIGEPTTVMVQGVSFVVLGGTVEPGDEVSVGTNGVAVKATAQTQATDSPFAVTPATKVVGICMVGGGEGAIGSVLLK